MPERLRHFTWRNTGRGVTLLERGEIASEASGVNAGGIGALGWGHVPNLESYLTMGSLQIFRSLQIELGYDIEFRASGALQAIQTARQYEYSRDNVLSLKSRGYTAELLTVNEARSIEPELNPELLGAVHFPLRGQADPQKATRAFVSAAADRGAQVLTGREVTGITRLGDGTYRSRLLGGSAYSQHAGPGGRGLVRAAGQDAGTADTSGSGAGADVGDGTAAAASVSFDFRGRVTSALERFSRQ